MFIFVVILQLDLLRTPTGYESFAFIHWSILTLLFLRRVLIEHILYNRWYLVNIFRFILKPTCRICDKPENLRCSCEHLMYIQINSKHRINPRKPYLAIAGACGIGDNKTQSVTPNPVITDLSENCVKFHNCCLPFFLCFFKLL